MEVQLKFRWDGYTCVYYIYIYAYTIYILIYWFDENSEDFIRVWNQFMNCIIGKWIYVDL